MEEVAEARTLSKLLAVMDNASHPIHNMVVVKWSTFSSLLDWLHPNVTRSAIGSPSCQQPLDSIMAHCEPEHWQCCTTHSPPFWTFSFTVCNYVWPALFALFSCLVLGTAHSTWYTTPNIRASVFIDLPKHSSVKFAGSLLLLAHAVHMLFTAVHCQQ